MEILRLQSITDSNVDDLLELMSVLDSTVKVTPEVLRAAAQSAQTYLFAAVEDGHIIGTASLCITSHPLGQKGGIEDVVVSPAARGRHIGRLLMEHIIDFAGRELSPIELHLTSRPSREKANLLYQSVGFKRHQTNVYKLVIGGKPSDTV